jgi:Mn-containing catalase
LFLRLHRLPIEPLPSNSSPDGAAAVQELLGGRFGEMSTLMNRTFQSFNFRGRDQARRYYDLIANIAAEEYSHIELVTYATTCC